MEYMVEIIGYVYVEAGDPSEARELAQARTSEAQDFTIGMVYEPKGESGRYEPVS